MSDRENPQASHALSAQAEPEPLPVAVRVFSETPQDPDPKRQRKQRRRGRQQREDFRILVIDTETTTCRAQDLLFGVARYCRTRHAGGKPLCVREMIFHADDLPERDPDGYQTLWDYAGFHEPAVDWTPGDPLTEDAGVQIALRTATEFRDDFITAAYDNRALVVAFNFPFDASRFAVSHAETRGGRTRRQQQASSFQGGFTLRYHEWNGKPNRFKPELRIKTIDSKRALKQFSSPAEIEDHDLTENGLPFRGNLLDLRTAAFALTDRGHTLESACEAFGVTYFDVLGETGCERRRIPRKDWREPYRKQETEHGKITAEYTDYCRDDVSATVRLYEAISAEYRKHPISLQITKAYSAASIGKGYNNAGNVRPRLKLQPDFPRDTLGYAMVAYSGGRAECHLRRVPMPVIYTDFLSMYNTVNSLMGLWWYVIAQRIDMQDATDEIRALVERVTVEDCLDPALWRELPALVQIMPAGDVLPDRARYDSSRTWSIGSNPFYSDEPLWYALPDVIASKIITGRTPEIIQARKLVAVGRQRGLKPVKLRGEVEIVLRTQDLFKAAIEQRRQLEDKNGPTGKFLKTFSLATSYGIYAETLRRELPAGCEQEVTVYGHRDQTFTAMVSAPEELGRYAFPPIAACITAGARLMLAILEVLVARRGGTWVFCDTDSMAIVANEHGGLVPCPGGPERDEHGGECVRALSWAQVDEIVEQFKALNPYDHQVVPGSVLEIEDENFELDPTDFKRKRVLRDKPLQLRCYSISAKRYNLHNLDETGRPVMRKFAGDDDDTQADDGEEASDVGTLEGLRKHSEHGLGHLLNPIDPEDTSRDWIAQIWQYILAADAYPGTPAAEPYWLDRIALTRYTINTPRLLKPYEQEKRVGPYNFGLLAHVHNTLNWQELPRLFLLVAPYESDPREWLDLPWTNAYEPGSRYKIVPYSPGMRKHRGGRIPVKTYRDVLAEYRIHPEAKSLGPDGKRCSRRTIGLLRRRPLSKASLHTIGKEANKIEERGLVRDLDELQTEYSNPEQDPLWQLVVRVLNLGELTVEQIADGARVSADSVWRARASKLTGKTLRARETRENIARYIQDQAGARIRASGIQPPSSTEALLATVINLVERRRLEQVCALEGCEKPARPRGRYCSDRCARNDAKRRRRVHANEPKKGQPEYLA